MEPFLTQLQQIDVKVPGLKERIFNQVVDLRQRQFNQLCNEVIALYRFQKKYHDALITDEPHLIKPFVKLLPRVELRVEITEHAFDRGAFFRWLETVEESTLQQIVMEIDALYDEAIENVDCYVVDEKMCAHYGNSTCWKMQLETSGNLSVLFKNLTGWKH